MKKRTAVILKWVGIVVVVLGFAYGAMDFASRRALKREYDALRAEGRPMDLREIVPPAIPDAENAALVYNAAVQMLQAEPPVKLDGYEAPSGHEAVLYVQLVDVASSTLEYPTNAVATEHAARLLDHPRVVEFLASIERGTARPGYRQELDYSYGPGMLLPHLPQNRNVSRTLSVLARHQSAAGKTDDAWRTALTGIRFADSLRTEPIIISQLVRVAQLQIAMDALRSVAEVAPPSAEDCAKLEALLASFENRKPLVRTFDFERLAMGEWAFKLPASEITVLGDNADKYLADKYLLAVSAVFRPLRGVDHAAYLRVLHGYTRSAAEPYAPGDPEFGDRLLKEVPRYCILTRMAVPTFSAFEPKFTGMIAQARVTRAGLAAIRFKQEHGAYPADLQVLKLANADDPFTSKPLIYRPADRGFTLYSVGVNLVDDGGTEGKDSKSGDLAWRYEERNPAEQPAGGDGKPAPQP